MYTQHNSGASTRMCLTFIHGTSNTGGVDTAKKLKLFHNTPQKRLGGEEI
jgi:hypothetical protein